MSTSPVLVFIDSVPGRPIAEALLRPYAVEIVQGYTSSGALSLAQSHLLSHPDGPVVLLVNADTENQRELTEMRAAGKRLLAWASLEGWYLAIAVPRLDAWAMTDPRIRRDLETSLDARAIFSERAARIAELTKTQPFDPTQLYRTNADFRGLVEFLQKHAPATVGTSAKAASG
jgi:hypothetical protein